MNPTIKIIRTRVATALAGIRKDIAREKATQSREDLIRTMAEKGHKLDRHVIFTDQDDSKGYSVCTCGWRSSSMKVANVDDAGVGHLRQIAKRGT